MGEFVGFVPSTPDESRWRVVVRGYPSGVEVLTESGFVSFDRLYSEDLLGDFVPFVGSNYSLPGFAKPQVREFGSWLTNGNFPRLATVNPINGRVSFERPTQFNYFDYDGVFMHYKARGVDMLCTPFTDLWGLGRYGRSWKFYPAWDMYKNRTSKKFYYGFVDKFNVDLYGDFVPQVRENGESGLIADLINPIHIYPNKHILKRRINDFYKHVNEDGKQLDLIRTEVNVFNVVMPSYHNLIIRRGKEKDSPRVRWVGNPILAGDGFDKSVIKFESISNPDSNIPNVLRHDWSKE